MLFIPCPFYFNGRVAITFFETITISETYLHIIDDCHSFTFAAPTFCNCLPDWLMLCSVVGVCVLQSGELQVLEVDKVTIQHQLQSVLDDVTDKTTRLEEVGHYYSL